MGIWYRQGTASIANGATAVTGALTGWLNQVKPGDGISFDAGGRWYEVASVESNTALTLVTPFGEATIAGGAYAVDRRSPKWTITSDLALQVANLLASATHILQGTEPPPNTLGVDDDVYFKLGEPIGFYGPKAGGVWPPGVSLGGDRYKGSSTSSVAIGLGAKAFEVQALLAHVVGGRVRFAHSPAEWIEGQITSYSGTTMAVLVDRVAGAGTFASWDLTVAGDPGGAATIEIGAVSTAASGDPASVENVGTPQAAVLNFAVPQGVPGLAATVEIGDVSTAASGDPASVENVGTPQAAVLNFAVPQGAPGLAATVEIGGVSTVASGVPASIENAGTPQAAVLNFSIPEGEKGDKGNPGTTVPDISGLTALPSAVASGDLFIVRRAGTDYKADADNLPAAVGGGDVPSTRLISTGAGLTGGGDLSADRSLALSAGAQASLALADSAVQPGTLSGYVPTARQVSAGAGLTGGGDLTANRSLALTAGVLASLGRADTAVQRGELFLNVRDFGAVGNGTTDDTAAIQAAVDALPNSTNELQRGGILVLPDGNFKISQPIVVNKNCEIFGIGNATISGNVSGASTKAGFVLGAASYLSNSATGYLRIVVRRINFDLTGHDFCIQSLGVRTVRIEECTTRNGAIASIFIRQAWSTSWVKGCWFEGGGYTALHLYENCNAFDVSGNRFAGYDDTPSSGLGLLIEGSAGVWVHHNDFEYCTRHLIVRPLATANCNNSHVENNWFEGAIEQNVIFDNTSYPFVGITFRGNSVWGPSNGNVELGVAAGAGAIAAAVVDGNVFNAPSTLLRASAASAYSNLSIRGNSPTGVNLPVRDVLAGNRNYYVRTDGNDANDGLANTSGSAFKTIQNAIDVAASLDLSIYGVTINVADGTYTGTVRIKPYIGTGPITIRGNTSTPANCVIHTTSADAVASAVDAMAVGWVLTGFTLRTTTFGYCVSMDNASSITLGVINFGAADAHCYAQRGARIFFSSNYTISGGGGWHWFAADNGIIYPRNFTIAITGTPAFGTGFAVVARGGVIHAAGMTFTGTATGTRYVASGAGIIETFGGGASYLPGSVSGSATAPGAYL